MSSRITVAEAQNSLLALVDRVVSDHDILEIEGTTGRVVVMMAKEDYDSLMETWHLLSSPANATRLLRSMDQTKRGSYHLHDIPELDE
ncbi:type II toxin-antitoxin system Phd/YefM family antitoxin [Prescottella equi]|uniref:type II toxin-antitoxin system Phd/YefM family antitoxin n=1 Tax=Rhodococcus hoagii TaxID=43767 RepID=UPI0023DAB3A4|nr:type II toxin-antitoxin system Phd/YefM family antitoxin [Prescottella equi]